MSELRRLFGVFWEPGAAFADIARRPRWWIPMAILIVLGLVYTYALSQRIGWEEMIRQGIEQSSQTQNLSAADRERIIQQQAKFAGIFGYVGALLATPVSLLIIAGLLTLFYVTFFGAAAKYKNILGVTTYAHLPGIVTVGIMMAVMYLKPPEDFDPQNPVGLNLGFYLHDVVPKWVVSIGNSIDLMSFWVIALLVIGLQAADPKAGKQRAWMAVLIPWGVYVLGKALFAMIRG